MNKTVNKLNQSIMEVKNLSYHIQRNHLLNDISLCIQGGESIALVGANGAGKTTLIKALLGLIKSPESTVFLQNRDIASLHRGDIAQLVSYVPQQLPDNISFTVIEFITMSRYSYASGTFASDRDDDGKQITQDVIQQLGIEHLAQQSMATLSGGECQKVNLAAALAQQTPIIVLDEPTAHLDPHQKNTIQGLLADLSGTKTLISITHDLNWAATKFDRVLGMKHGQLLLDTAASDFITQENLQLLFENKWSIFPHPATGQALVFP
ncbi:MAG: ABC transporter ATP-binding protein [Akkermansiaceae bacterium]